MSVFLLEIDEGWQKEGRGLGKVPSEVRKHLLCRKLLSFLFIPGAIFHHRNHFIFPSK